MSRPFRAPWEPVPKNPPVRIPIWPGSRRGLLGGLAALDAPSIPALANEGVNPSRPLPARRPSPDADLIRICEGHAAVLEALQSCNCLEDCPYWLAYERSRDAIHAAVPMTLAGMVAKARAAKLEARNLDGTENPDGCPAENWAWDLVNDLVRLAGEA
jgi:hypothetical protein